jgi:hypothetical protein
MIAAHPTVATPVSSPTTSMDALLDSQLTELSALVSSLSPEKLKQLDAMHQSLDGMAPAKSFPGGDAPRAIQCWPQQEGAPDAAASLRAYLHTATADALRHARAAARKKEAAAVPTTPKIQQQSSPKKAAAAAAAAAVAAAAPATPTEQQPLSTPPSSPGYHGRSEGRRSSPRRTLSASERKMRYRHRTFDSRDV